MNANFINPFLAAIENVLNQFGVAEIKKGNVAVKEEMVIHQEVSAFVGIVGDIRGNVAYCFSSDTAKNMASAMMMGMAVTELDEISRSAIAELANMFTGNAASLLANQEVKVDITPPSVVVGKEMFMVLSSVKTLTISFVTLLGNIEVNICLEV